MGIAAFGQDTAKDIWKKSGQDVEESRKCHGKAAKNAGKGVAKGTKKGNHKTGNGNREGRQEATRRPAPQPGWFIQPRRGLRATIEFPAHGEGASGHPVHNCRAEKLNLRPVSRALRSAPGARWLSAAISLRCLDQSSAGGDRRDQKHRPAKASWSWSSTPAAIACLYEQGGAVALVLTDEKHFQGSLSDLESARGAATLPALRKDFTIDAYHVHEAAAYGADAILLIAAILFRSDRQMRDFREFAESAAVLAALVEVHTKRRAGAPPLRRRPYTMSTIAICTPLRCRSILRFDWRKDTCMRCAWSRAHSLH